MKKGKKMSEFSKAMEHLLGLGTEVNLTRVLEVVNAIVAAAPAIEQGIASVEPYVEAIVSLVKNGGNPSDADWLALRARLDQGSAALATAAAAPAEAPVVPSPAQEPAPATVPAPPKEGEEK